jgi:osmoprotectant transport system substrate-binding protein
MRMRAKVVPPLLLAAALLAACGQSGSSGSSAAGGSSSSSGGSSSAAGGSCAPVAGQQLVVLQDDKHLQAADAIVPLVNTKTAQADPALVPALDAVSAKLTTDDLIKLNSAVDNDRKSATDVASAWVSSNKVGDGLQKGSGKVVVGGSNFTESQILANVYADVLKSAGFDATVQAVGNRDLYLKALEAGDIQAFPEYLATVTEALNKQVNGATATTVASGDVDATLTKAKPLAQQEGLTFGTPSKATDQNAYAVTKAFADQHKVTTLSQLAAACGSGLVLGGPTECPTRPFCQPGLEHTYNLKFSGFKQLDAGGPLTKTALRQGQVSIGLIFSSDGSLAQQ